jgi:glycosyltransferase involved in cell wall biosynthesis
LDDGKEIDIIGSCIDLNRFRTDLDGSPIRRGFGIPPQARVASVIGMIRPDKAQRFLIQAVDAIVEKVPEAWFLIVGGPTRPEFLTRLEDEVSRIVRKDRVILTGYRSDVENFIAASDVVVHTALNEAWSQVVLQAFAMRKPVVAANIGGIPENVVDGQTGFLYPPGDVDQLGKLVTRVLTTDVAALLDRAHAHVNPRLGIDHMMEATLRTYRKAMGSLLEE